jgi:uncharacterized membrane protein YedE/YeeE
VKVWSTHAAKERIFFTRSPTLLQWTSLRCSIGSTAKKDKAMTIDWNVFTPWSALIGGLVIGLAAALFALLNGRIAGICGIVAGMLIPTKGEWLWRSAFVLGLIAAPLLYALFATLPILQIDAGYGALIIAGLLIGIGGRYGSGCTSGHGVCGLSRLSLRSLVATISFMSSGFATVFVIRHLLN